MGDPAARELKDARPGRAAVAAAIDAVEALVPVVGGRGGEDEIWVIGSE